jgi:hypothetical protein
MSNSCITRVCAQGGGHCWLITGVLLVIVSCYVFACYTVLYGLIEAETLDWLL